MSHLAGHAGSVPLALGLVLFVVGVVTDGIAVAAIGIIVLLTGLYVRSRQTRASDR